MEPAESTEVFWPTWPSGAKRLSYLIIMPELVSTCGSRQNISDCYFTNYCIVYVNEVRVMSVCLYVGSSENA